MSFCVSALLLFHEHSCIFVRIFVYTFEFRSTLQGRVLSKINDRRPWGCGSEIELKTLRMKKKRTQHTKINKFKTLYTCEVAYIHNSNHSDGLYTQPHWSFHYTHRFSICFDRPSIFCLLLFAIHSVSFSAHWTEQCAHYASMNRIQWTESLRRVCLVARSRRYWLEFVGC